MLPAIFSSDMTSAGWPQRREQLVELFRIRVFGRAPAEPYTVSSERLYAKPLPNRQAMQEYYRITLTTVRGSAAFHMALYIPQSEAPVPAVLMICNHDKTAVPAAPPDFSAANALMAAAPASLRKMLQGMMVRRQKGGMPAPHLLDIEQDLDTGYWPVLQILDSGRAAAAFYASEVQPDDRTRFPGPLASLFADADAPREADSWGTLGVWAFAASRAVDVLCEHPSLDAARISVAGHSRGGKTALWCAAQDERISAVLVNNSGCSGAAISRGKRGECVASINAIFPHWFCPNYARYSWREDEMPFDQHMLLAAVAPRLCYVTSGTEDLWSDPDAEWNGTVQASAAWQLFGDAPLGGEPPAAGIALADSRIGYHRRAGGHDLTAWDWSLFLQFLDRHQS